MKKFKIELLNLEQSICFVKETKWPTYEDCHYYAYRLMSNKDLFTFKITQL